MSKPVGWRVSACFRDFLIHPLPFTVRNGRSASISGNRSPSKSTSSTTFGGFATSPKCIPVFAASLIEQLAGIFSLAPVSIQHPPGEVLEPAPDIGFEISTRPALLLPPSSRSTSAAGISVRELLPAATYSEVRYVAPFFLFWIFLCASWYSARNCVARGEAPVVVGPGLEALAAALIGGDANTPPGNFVNGNAMACGDVLAGGGVNVPSWELMILADISS